MLLVVISVPHDWEGLLGLLFHPLSWAMAANVKPEPDRRTQGVPLLDVHTCMSSPECVRLDKSQNVYLLPLTKRF